VRSRRLLLVLAGLAGAAVALAGGVLLALPYAVDLPRVQTLLQAEATRLLDRPVRFERVSLSYWPLPAVRVLRLRVANPPGFGSEPLLAVDEARVRVRLLPLLRGRLQFGELTLASPRVLVEQRRDGSWNLPVPGPSRPGPAAPFVLVSRVRLQDGQVEIRVPGPGATLIAAHLVDRIDVALDDLGWHEPIRLHLAARLPGGGLSLTVEGQIGPLAAAGTDLAGLPARLAARFLAEERARAADAPFWVSGKGEGVLRVAGPLGNLTGEGRLSFPRLTVSQRPGACPGRAPGALVIEAVEAPVEVAGPRIAFRPFGLRVAGGTVRGGAVLTWRAGAPTVQLADVRIQDVAAEPIVVDFLCQPYGLTGRVAGTGEVAFSGTGEELLRSARGRWQLQAGPGRLVGPAVLSLVSGVLRVGSALLSVATLDPGSLLASPLEFQSLAAAGTVADGQVRVRQLAMQSQNLRVSGLGSYGLVDRRLDFDLEVRTGPTAFAVKVGGTPESPSYQAASRSLLQGLTDALRSVLPPSKKRPADPPRP
jgi:AsmA protein